jgi:hypothetical protein
MTPRQVRMGSPGERADGPTEGMLAYFEARAPTNATRRALRDTKGRYGESWRIVIE